MGSSPWVNGREDGLGLSGSSTSAGLIGRACLKSIVDARRTGFELVGPIIRKRSWQEKHTRTFGLECHSFSPDDDFWLWQCQQTKKRWSEQDHLRRTVGPLAG
jgi:hypothetical protein